MKEYPCSYTPSAPLASRVLIWLLVGFAAAAVAVLLVFEDHKQAELTIRTPPTTAAPTSPGAAPTVEIRMIPTIRFDASELRVRQGEVTVRADNADAPLSHDWALL